MAKGSRRIVYLGFLLLPLLYAVFIRVNPHHFWKFQVSNWPSNLSLKSGSSGLDGGEYMRFLLRRLVRGRDARRELVQDGVSCVADRDSTICATAEAVRITTGPSPSPTVYLTGGQRPAGGRDIQVRPYPRNSDPVAMEATAPVTLTSGGFFPPRCRATHTVPAVIFSTGGYSGNFFHDVNDVLIPLFITAARFRSRVKLVVTDHELYWVEKWQGFLSHLSAFDVIVASSPSSAVPAGVHCFPAAIVGLKYHSTLECNSTLPPGGATTLDFKDFLQDAYGLGNRRLASPVQPEKPLLVLISRGKSRAILNEDEVVRAAEEAGFRVEVALPGRMRHVAEFASVVNSASVLMGAHGAGLANMVFLPAEAVLLQVVPWGLDWASKTYYGAEVAARFGVKYVEYRSEVEESTLYGKYPKDDPVLTDPWKVHKMGYDVAKPIYIEGQNLTVDVSRLRGVLQQAMDMLPSSS